MIGQVFHVVTEFRFEVGSALLGTEKLQSAVEGVSSAADSALVSFQKLGLGVAAQFGLGTSGVLGVLGLAVKSFDKFKQSQIALANVMGASGDPFANRMAAAAGAMERMNGIANEFGLPVDDLIQMTKLIGPMLNNEKTASGKGLAGPGFSNAISLSRSLLKSAPTLGVDPGLVQGQMQNMISGHASMGDTLFQRLVSDTQAMAEFKTKGSKGFNALDGAKRVELMSKALDQFSKDAEVLSANVDTLRGQMTIFGNTISSSVGILRQVGEALMVPIVKIFKAVNSYLANQGKEIFKQLSRAVGPWIKDPERFIGMLMQMSKLKADVNIVKNILGITGAMFGLQSVLGFLNVKIPFISAGLAKFTGALTAVSAAEAGMLGTTGILGTLNVVTFGITRFVAGLTLLIGLMSFFSRVAASAKIEETKRMLNAAPAVAENAANLSRIFDVIDEGVQRIADGLGKMWASTIMFDLGTGIIQKFTEVMGMFLGWAQGAAFAFMELFNQIQNSMFGQGFSFSAISDAWTAGVDMMMERILGGAESGESGISGNVTNIAKVEIRNEFKEQQEPDRIAFSLKDQLLKAAQNPTQRRGGSLQAATVGR